VDIVGGEVDVWTAHQNGFLAVCAFGETQGAAKLVAALLALGIGRVRVTLDADGAGEAGALELWRECQKQGLAVTLRRFQGGDGHDVCDEFSRVGFDRAKFRAAFEALPEVEPRDLEAARPNAKTKAPHVPKISTARELMARELMARELMARELMARELMARELMARELMARELMARDIPPARFIAPGLIAEGLTIFAGNPKLGKSWLMLGLGLAVAFGGAWLGSVFVERGDVLFLALEDNERRMKTRLAKCLQGQEAPENFHYATEWRRIDEGGVSDLEAWLKEHPNARLVVVDTLQKVKPRRRSAGNVYEQDSDDVGALKALADRYGVAIVCIHHRRKGSEGGDDLEAVSGSYGLTGAADGILSLKRERGRSDAVLTATGRDLEEEKELALRFDSTLGAWALLGDAEEYRMSEERAKVAAAIRDAGEPLTPKGIFDLGAAKSHETARFLCSKMAREGQLTALGGGRYCLAEGGNFLDLTAHTPHSHRSHLGRR